MTFLRRMMAGVDFTELDRQIERIREIRDSYRAENVRIYGEKMAELLNDWQ